MITQQFSLFDESALVDESPAHEDDVYVPVPDSAGLVEKFLHSLVRDNLLPLYTTWPRREWPTSKVGDMYAYRKPHLIGHVEVIGFVKGNKGWVLHGRVHYRGGKRLYHELLASPRVVMHYVDIERGNPSKGRRAISLDHLLVSPK